MKVIFIHIRKEIQFFKQVLTLNRKKTMKRYFFMAVAGMLALSSCSNDSDEMVVADGPRPMTFTAGYGDGADTRATLNGLNVIWDANDEISILSEKNANAKFTTRAGGTTATFGGNAVNDTKFYAVYPYTAGLTLNGTTDGATIKGIKIPDTQYNAVWGSTETSVKSGWDPKAPVALAVTGTDMKLRFTNLCAILKTTIANNPFVYRVEVSTDQDLAGTFDLNTTSNTLRVTSGSKKVSTGTGEQYIKAARGERVIYLAVAPGTYTNFTFKQYLSYASGYNNTISKIKNTPVTFEAGKIYDLTSSSSTMPQPGSVTFSSFTLSGDQRTLSALSGGITLNAVISGAGTFYYDESSGCYTPSSNNVEITFKVIPQTGMTVTNANIFGDVAGAGPWTFTYNNGTYTLKGTTTSFHSTSIDSVTIYYIK